MPEPEVNPDPAGPDPIDPGHALPIAGTAEPESTKPRATDPKLIAAAKAGDEAALRRLLAPEPDRLYAVCLGMLRDPDVARDAAQDALVRIIRGLDTYDGRARFTTWTTRIALNVCLTRLREVERRARLDAKHAAGSRLTNREPDAVSRVQGAERGRRAAEALSQLSEEHRTVLVLRDVRGLDLDRISEALGLPIGTVKSRLFRARIALRGVLADQEPD